MEIGSQTANPVSPAQLGDGFGLTGAHAEHHGPNVEKILTYAMLATTILAAAVVVAPLGLPKLGVGEEVEQKLMEECCENIRPKSGLAFALSKTINDIPVIGT